MDEQHIGALIFADYKADVYSTATPGKFHVVYLNASGERMEEETLSGISTYRQREAEITARLEELHNGAAPSTTPRLGDAGEY